VDPPQDASFKVENLSFCKVTPVPGSVKRIVAKDDLPPVDTHGQEAMRDLKTKLYNSMDTNRRLENANMRSKQCLATLKKNAESKIRQLSHELASASQREKSLVEQLRNATEAASETKGVLGTLDEAEKNKINANIEAILKEENELKERVEVLKDDCCRLSATVEARHEEATKAALKSKEEEEILTALKAETVRITQDRDRALEEHSNNNNTQALQVSSSSSSSAREGVMISGHAPPLRDERKRKETKRLQTICKLAAKARGRPINMDVNLLAANIGAAHVSMESEGEKTRTTTMLDAVVADMRSFWSACAEESMQRVHSVDAGV
jgi:chromosome segregation ATPase